MTTPWLQIGVSKPECNEVFGLQTPWVEIAVEREIVAFLAVVVLAFGCYLRDGRARQKRWDVFNEQRWCCGMRI